MKLREENLETIIETPPFNLEKFSLIYENDSNQPNHPFYRLRAKDWINVVPITKEGQVVLIEQPRAGPLCNTLEIPGGVVDAGEQPEAAVIRELEEETGYKAQTIEKLGAINPNPAFMTNTLHVYIAKGCSIAKNRQRYPDASERIELKLFPLTEISEIVRSNRVGSALAALGLLWAEPTIRDLAKENG